MTKALIYLIQHYKHLAIPKLQDNLNKNNEQCTLYKLILGKPISINDAHFEDLVVAKHVEAIVPLIQDDSNKVLALYNLLMDKNFMYVKKIETAHSNCYN